MGEEVIQLVISDGGGKPHVSADEVDRAIPASSCVDLIEKCEDCNGGVTKEKKYAKKIIAINPDVAAKKPQEISIEKTRKWYSFIHRSSKNNNSCESKISTDKMDKRHSWHLNETPFVEM